MEALVLLGGAGTRLRPLTYDTAKPMLPVIGRPMIARIVEWLAQSDVSRVIFSLGYRPDAFLAAFPEGTWAGIELVYAVEPEPLDTAGAIRFAVDEAGTSEGPIVVVNGDVLCDLDLAGLVVFHRQRGAGATIALTPVEDPSAYGVVVTDDDGRVEAFIEKPPAGTAPTNLINAGTYVLESGVICSIPTGRRVSIEREIFPRLVEDRTLFAKASASYWIDTGTPEDFLRAQVDIVTGRRVTVAFPTSECRAGGVRLAVGARTEGAHLRSCFIGEGAVVEVDASVEESVIGEGAVVGAGSRVVRSVVLARAQLSPGTVLEDSIVGCEAMIGERAVVKGASVIGRGAVIEAGARLDNARVPV